MKVTNDRFIFYIRKINRSLAKQMMQLKGKYLQQRDLLVNKRDLLALYLSGTYCHKTGTGPPSFQLLEN